MKLLNVNEKGLEKAKSFQTNKILALIVLTLFLTACTVPIQKKDDSASTPVGVSSVVDANNQFAFEIYPNLQGKNVFFSPYSISTALAMVYEGAKGQTAEEMQNVFHFPENLKYDMAKLYNQINQNKDLKTANALWAQQDYQFLPEYFNTIDTYYGGKATNLDFKTETEKSREIINTWVEEQTNDKIKDLLGPGDLNSLTRLVLTNAIYFKDQWLYEFDKDDTRDMNFNLDNEEKVKVPMMYLDNKDATFNYAKTGDLQIIEFPYKDEELSMLILLPDNINSFDIDADKLNEYKNMMTKRQMKVYLPKFKLETKYHLNQQLTELGMPTAFSRNADFSGMDGTTDLYISTVIHQAFVDVNEEGTEAAAATVVVMDLKAASIPNNIFKADHPFMFLIQQKTTGNILFMGRVDDPR